MATSPYRNSKIEGRSNPRGLPRSRPQVSTIEDRPTQDVPLVPSLDDVDIFEKKKHFPQNNFLNYMILYFSISLN
jgi:hypothetical protein